MLNIVRNNNCNLNKNIVSLQLQKCSLKCNVMR